MSIVEESGESYVERMKPPSACAPSKGVKLAGMLAPLVMAGTLLIAGSAPAAEPTDTSPQSAPVTAKWVSRKIQYTYQGFTAHYSCDGLQESVKRILLKLGAREDLNVRQSGCVRLEGPEPMPGVDVTFSVLEPVSSADQGDPHDVAARWENVRIQASTPTRENSGDCALIEDIKKRFLPLFATRNVQYSSDCFPHTESIEGADLKVDVLRPIKPPKPQPAQH